MIRAAILGGAMVAVAGVSWLVIRLSGGDGSDQRHARYAMKGMVLKVAPSHRSFIVSHDSIPGVMDAMTMAFDVGKPNELGGVTPGMMVEFTLVAGTESFYAEHVQIRAYEPVEQDPLTAGRLKLLTELTRPSSVKALLLGETVPDFALIDQLGRNVTMTQLRGRVVAINFIYTSCVLPQFCFRTANNFSAIEKRFKAYAGKDLVLLTVTFDPARDTPERLAEYASQWEANPNSWHFLTGSVQGIKRVCDLFGVDFFPDEGLMNHSSHAVVIDKRGQLVANVEGNQYTAKQIGDLVESALNESGSGRSTSTTSWPR